MGQLLGGIVAIWWLSLLINFIIMKSKKQESRETRLNATISAVLIAVVISTFLELMSEVSTREDIMGHIIAYSIGGVVIYFTYVRRFKKQ
jgi:Ca2+/Na+ antiporter